MTEGPLHTFMFADICGYSLLTEADGDDAAADVAIHFLSEASSLAREHGAEVVKGLGDAVMVYADDAAEAIRMGLNLLTDLWRGSGPPVHPCGRAHRARRSTVRATGGGPR